MKKLINQNDKLNEELINTIEANFVFDKKPINRFSAIKKESDISQRNKQDLLENLKKQLNSIDNCKLKSNSKNIVLGEGNIDSPIMLIGEAPGEIEDKVGNPFKGESGELLDKMLIAINIKRQNIYTSYAINFRPPDPKIIILMGSTAMEAVTGINEKISSERGKWKEIILNNNTYPLMITFNPSYLIRYPDNKKYSWEDLKKIREKVKELKLTI